MATLFFTLAFFLLVTAAMAIGGSDSSGASGAAGSRPATSPRLRRSAISTMPCGSGCAAPVISFRNPED